MLTQSSIYKEYLDLMDTEAWKLYFILKIYKLQQIYIYIYILSTVSRMEVAIYWPESSTVPSM